MADGRSTDLGIEGLGEAVRIGSGGFADVYRAEQLNLRRQVAVKVLRGAPNDAQSRLRFERECHALGAVSDHPHIVGVHRSGFTEDGRAYLIMEFCPGGSLLDRIRRDGVMTGEQVVDVGSKVGKALAVAHDAGVLHRDVKPANILVTAYGEPALADFGIARVEGADQTATGQITASFTHAAPEVLQGEAPSVRSDVYSLGSTLFELCTGSPGHVRAGDESAWMLIRRATTEPHPDPALAGIAEPLASAIRRATLSLPDHRQPSVGDLVADLNRTPGPEAGAGTAPGTSDTVTRIAPSNPDPGPEFAATATLPEPAARAPSTRPADPPPTPHPAAPDPSSLPLASQGATAARPQSFVPTGPGAQPGPVPMTATGRSRRLPIVIGLLVLAAAAGVGIGFGIVALRDDVPPVTFAFPDGQSGPLDVGRTYDLDIAGGDDETRFELLLDGRAIDAPSTAPTSFTPETSGRHALVIRSTRGDDVATTGAIELYVIGDLPPPGYRANLASLTTDPANWAGALARYDELVADGHDGLEILPSSRFPALQPGFWNLYVPGFGQERTAGLAYCEEFGLSIPDECFVTEFIPEP